MIAVPKSELVIPRFDPKGVQHTYNGSAVCEFGVWNSTSGAKTGLYTLGDTLLRSAYVVCGPFLSNQAKRSQTNPSQCRCTTWIISVFHLRRLFTTSLRQMSLKSMLHLFREHGVMR